MRRFGRGSGLALSRYAEYEALAAVGSAYEAWVRANTRLDDVRDGRNPTFDPPIAG